MSNSSVSPYQGACIAPFLDESLFKSDVGFIPGRFCAPIQSLQGSPSCCLPCPATEWVFADSFETYGVVSEALNVVGLALMVFMLVSYIILPAQKTRSHYLSICLIVACVMLSLGFTVPLAAQPEQCANAITPNDMYSSTECAWSGAFIIAGGISAVMWILIRALSMNLQICWDIVPGKKFFYISQAVGWGIPAILFTATMTATGVSFRFGNACHVNHDNSMAAFWGPLMAFAAAAGILQLMTFAYCIHVYLKNLWSDTPQTSSASGSGLPSHNTSIRTQTARAVYQRLKKVLWLQWRGICIVSIILIDVVFFAIVFIYLDGMQQNIVHDWKKVEPWTFCLAMNPGNKGACLHLVEGWLVNQGTVEADLLLLSVTGLQVFLFLTRPSVFSAWADFFRRHFTRRQEFVSLDARSPQGAMHPATEQKVPGAYEYNHQNTAFEMQQPHHMMLDIDSKTMTSETVLSSPDEAYRSPYHVDLSQEYGRNDSISPTNRVHYAHEYFGRVTPISELPERSSNSHGQTISPVANAAPQLAYSSSMTSAHGGRSPIHHNGSTDPWSHGAQRDIHSRDSERRYRAPSQSFSAPNAPSRASSTKSVSFDPRELYARSGIALNPPEEVGESRENLTASPQGNAFGDHAYR